MRGVSVKINFFVVLRVITDGAVTALECTGRPLPYISCHKEHQWDILRPVINIFGGVQFLININPKV
jgi:hypothetical protein